MAIPAYMWVKDDGGADIKGSVDVTGREGSIEVLSFMHGLNIPTLSLSGNSKVGTAGGPKQRSTLQPIIPRIISSSLFGDIYLVVL